MKKFKNIHFLRTLDIPLINCEINLILTWSEIFVIKSKATRDAGPDADLEQFKIGFKITIKWKKYRSIIHQVEIKDFNALIVGKIIFDVPVKNKERTYQKIIAMSKNNDYTTGNLLDYEYFSKHYKLILIDLSKQLELENSFQNNRLILLVNLKMMKRQCFHQ